MATYFHGSSEIQAAGAAPPDHGIQTLYLMNPSYLSSYSDTAQQHHNHQPPPPSMLFFNPTAAAATNGGLNQANVSHPQPPNHHLVGIPLPSTDVSSTNPGVHYNIWGALDQNSGDAGDVVSTQMGFRRPLVASPARQGLSLTLSSQQAQGPTPYRAMSNEHDPIQAMHGHVSALSSGGEDIRVSGNSPSSASAVSNCGVSSMQSMVLGSKYLKAAQELLDEVVNVGKGIKTGLADGSNRDKMKLNKDSVTGDGSTSGGCNGDDGVENSSKPKTELSTAQRQELQMKKGKLVNMLDEVEQRYRQYHHQMQAVVSSFEQAAGQEAAKSYTALALRTISKQFRCLKDAISGQIKGTSKMLGEEDCLGVKVEGSRLRYVDHQLRQQRALQQLGMIQHNAWRPQRGLPERAVSVLRAWLFEHFLHPYPKDSDKHMLAKQTGLTRSQVSNWFINARVRLWKPMVEEMYMEEIKEQDRNGGGSDENASKSIENKDGVSTASAPGDLSTTALQMEQLKSLQSTKQEKPSSNQNPSPTQEFSNSTISMSPMGGPSSIHPTPQPGFTLIMSPEMEGIALKNSPKKPRTSSTSHDMQNSPSSILSMDMDIKQGDTSREMLGMNFGGGFGAYPMPDLGRFNPHEQLAPRFSGNNAVSLSLALPHCDNLSLSGSHPHQQNFLSNQNIQLGRRLEIGPSEADFCGINNSQNSHSTNGFDNINDIQNRKRFVAQLLPDFVA